MSEQPSITCPVCAKTSHHPDDVAQGYCGNCHDWTSPARDGVQIVNQLGLFAEGTPTHPDFLRLAAIVKQHDRVDIQDTIKVDMEALGLVANKRFERAVDLLSTEEDGTPISEHDRAVMLWIDAFAVGQAYGVLHGDTAGYKAPVQDGNRRQRRGKRT